MIAVSVLGATVLRRDGVPVPIPGGKVTELLVRLSASAGEIVPTDRLLDDLWGEDGGAARNTLQSKVSALRRAAGEPGIVRADGDGYRLGVARADVDAWRALALAEDAARHAARGAWAAASPLAAQGLALFRGVPLADARDAAWVLPLRARLIEARTRLEELALAARVESGEAADAVAGLEALVAEHSLRESAWVLLVTALARAGRGADALAAHARARQVLADELGVDPGPELAALHARLLGPDPALTNPALTSPPVPSLPDSPDDDLLGRAEDVQAVRALLRPGRVVTLVGPAGVGKTRLARHLAALDATAAAWTVRLDAVPVGAAEGAVAEAVGDAFGMTGAQPRALAERLAGTEGLVVLDNCEHVLDAVRALVSHVAERAPGVSWLATSQVPLRVPAEVVHPLDPLPLGIAADLFRRRAAAQRRGRQADAGDDAALHDLVRALDGLPLAIELAAARTKVLPVADILRRLDDRFRVLADPGGPGARRHRALDVALAWSYDLLFPDDQRGLWALACFAGDADLDGADAVMQALGVPAGAALDVVDRLVDRSLAHPVAGRTGLRFRLLDSVRAYARDRLREAGEEPAARAAHAAVYVARADRARADQQGPRQSTHLAVAVAERAEIDAAVAWAVTADPATALRIATGFGWTSVVLGHGGAGAHRLRTALAAAGGVGLPGGEHAYALALAAWNEIGADVARARAEAEAASRAAAGAGLLAETTAGFALAFAQLQSGDVAAAHATLDQLAGGPLATDAADAAWPRVMHAVLAGLTALASRNPDALAAALDGASPLLADVADPWLASHLEALAGQLALVRGQGDAAVAHLRGAARAAHEAEAGATEAFHLLALGRAFDLVGDVAAAGAAFAAAVDVALGVGLMRLVSQSRLRWGLLQRRTGDPSAAATLTQAHDWFALAGGGDEAHLAAAAVLAVTLAARPATAGSVRDVERLTTLAEAARGRGDGETEVICLDAVALWRARAGERESAVELLRRADAVAAAAGVVDGGRVDAHRVRALLP